MPRERVSIGPVKAEGPRASMGLLLILGVGLLLAFYLGYISALVNACFGLK